jgi:hypothetical protein
VAISDGALFVRQDEVVAPALGDIIPEIIAQAFGAWKYVQ